MRRLLCLLLALLTLSATLLAAETRQAAVAGAFYPDEPELLKTMVDGHIDQAPSATPAAGGRILAMIVPHAGFIYSGPTAGHVYRLLKENPVKTVVLVGPCHRSAMEGGASVWVGGDWQTPLGPVPVDNELAQKIASEDEAFRRPLAAHRDEHSLETQLPFIQRVLPEAKIVPILITDADSPAVQSLAKAIHKHLEGKDAVVLASTDLSHYHHESIAHRIDRHTLELLKKSDAEGLKRAHRNGSSEMCGHAAVQVALEYARLKGEHSVEPLHYSTSADTAGTQDRVVGYLAAVVREGRQRAAATEALDQAQQTRLLRLARETVEAHVQGRPLPETSTDDPEMKKDQAVFVTIRKHGELRGCIGRILAEEPLIEAVRNMSVESASSDPRFAPVTPDELKELRYEVSVLGPPMRVGDASEIEIGRHGVMLRQGRHGGVFLPKVAEDFGYDKEKFLDTLCAQKARLPVSCWQDPATEMDVFTAQEFAEPSPSSPAR